ncbi:Colicin I receptor [Thalassocella blandensis]|nr:Colicin I receptor [Thalassocella blandensis]
MVTTQLKTRKLLLASMISSLVAAHATAQEQASDNDSLREEEVIVRGFRNALSTSMDLKRDSTQLMEAITAEDIGKMPDQNIAESLQRLTGIQIDRNDGEGTKVRIRGLDQNITLLNGDTFLSGLEYFQLGEARVEFNDSLESIPSELLGGVEVYKSPKASLVEGGLGGTINLKTRNAFSLDGFLVAGNLKYDQGDESDEGNPSGAIVIGNNWDDKFAAILSFSATQKTVHADQAQTYSRQGFNVATLPDGTDYIRPGMLYFTDAETDRDRIGSSLALQWRPSEALELGFDWFHAELELDRRTYSVKHDMGVDGSAGLEAVYPYASSDKGADILTPDEYVAPRLASHDIGGASISHILAGTFIAGGSETNSSRELSDMSADNFRLKAAYDNQGKWRINSELSVSTADYESEYAFSDSRFSPYDVTMYTGNGPTGWEVGPNNDPTPDGTDPSYDDTDDDRSWTYNTGGSVPTARYADDGWLTDPQYLNYKSHWAFGDRVTNDAQALKVDAEFDIDAGDLKVISFGARVGNEEVEFIQGHYLADLAENGGLDTIDPNYNPTTSNGAGRPGVKATRGWELGDIDGDGISDAQLWGSEYRYLDPSIGDKCADATTSNGTPLCEAIYGVAFDRFGGTAPGVMNWETYLTQPNRHTTVTNFFPSASYQGNLIFDDAEKMGNPRSWFQGIAGVAPVNFREDPLESWEANETTTAAYLMADFVGDSAPYELNLGLRVVQTETEITISEASAALDRLWSTDTWNGAFMDANLSTKKKTYTDLLPSANFVWNLSDEQKIRASASRVLARPNLQDLGKGFNQDLTRDNDCNCFRFNGGTAGNPDLDPFRADQLDVSYEWYFGELNLASATVFYKKVDTFIATRSVQETHPDQTPEGESTAGVERPFNGDGGKVQGLELAYQMAFDNGFGFATNFTYSDSQTNLSSITHDELPLPGVSETSYNIIGFYENESFSARLAYTWRDEHLAPTNTTIGVTGLEEPLSSWYDDYGQLDASLTWNATKNLSVVAEAINITAEERTRYLEWESNFFTYDSQESRVVLGLNFRY